MPNQPATPLHSFRCPDERWDAALRKAHDEGTTLTEVLNACLERYLRD